MPNITHSLSTIVTCLLSVTAEAIVESEVLVIYNSENADSQEVKDYYLTKRTSVLTFDLNDATLSPGSISYADFDTKIRTPIRSHLNSNGLEEAVHVIVLTKGLPHRIQNIDISNPNIGDNASATVTDYNNGNANFASVDSELTLLQFDLETNEAGLSMDSVADRAVTNPYFNQTDRFNTYNRTNIDSEDLSFSPESPYGWWRINRQINPLITWPADAGNIYLTARLDASTVADVKAMIDRAQSITFRKDLDAILLDADARESRLDNYTPPSGGLTITDYTEATSALASDWAQLMHDETATFLIGSADTIAYSNRTVVTGPIAHLHSYGVNHTGTNSQIRDYLATFAGQLVPGASFSAYESFGAKGLGGLGNNGQAQVEEWLSAGGTFATGPVWEPFTFGISKSEIFLDRFMNQGFTYVEAAWCSILQLSWQSVVLGDPLATATFVDASPYEQWTFDQTGSTPYVNAQLDFSSDLDQDGQLNGLEYILGLDPATSDVNSGRQPSFQFVSSEQTISFKLDATNAESTTIQVETSTTLLPGEWTTIATRGTGSGWTGTATVSETLSNGLLRIELTDSSISSEGKRFYRISPTLD